MITNSNITKEKVYKYLFKTAIIIGVLGTLWIAYNAAIAYLMAHHPMLLTLIEVFLFWLMARRLYTMFAEIGDLKWNKAIERIALLLILAILIKDFMYIKECVIFGFTHRYLICIAMFIYGWFKYDSIVQAAHNIPAFFSNFIIEGIKLIRR